MSMRAMTMEALNLIAAPFGDTPSDVAAKAIYDAIDPLSGDPIATVIHMSDHLFWDDRLPGATDIERQLAAVRLICRIAACVVLETVAPK